MSLLGGFEVSLGNRPVQEFESNKSRALLAYLALAGRVPRRRETLVGLFWPTFTDRRARRNLSQSLYSLRRTLDAEGAGSRHSGEPPLFLADTHSVALNLERPIWLDVTHFRNGLAGCATHAPHTSPDCANCRAGAVRAVDLYRGQLLAGLSLDDCLEFEEWLVVEREALHRQAQSAFEKLAAWGRTRGDLDQALEYARRAIALDPLWEPAQREVMHCLWLAGRRAEALAQYELCRQTLAAELGVEPDQQTERLARRIRSDREIVSSGRDSRQALPNALTPFVGRQNELSQLETCLTAADCRLLTLLGTGGSGKTRLAVEVARRLSGRFPDGVYMVSLSGLDTSAAIAPRLAETLGLSIQPDRPASEQLHDFLREKRLLLILDSFERLLDGALLILDLLHVAPRLKILVTSRARLKVKSETLFPLGGLTISGENRDSESGDPEAVQLFLSAVRRVVPGYQPDPRALAAIAEVCRQVGGLPLGIILAAAWLEILSPAQIAAQIAQSLDFLAADWPDLPPRQRSLRATLDYSWGLLDNRLRALFAALSVFKAGFTLEAAQVVVGSSPQDLLAFVERSLLERTGPGRYLIHDLLHEFAAEKLAQNPEVQNETGRRHALYYVELLDRAAHEIIGPAQGETLAALDVESPNLSAAWAWAVESGQSNWLGTALEGLCRFYDIRLRYQEGERACRLAAETLTSRQPDQEELRLLARVSTWQARFARLSGDHDLASQLHPQVEEWLDQLAECGQDVRPERAFLYLEQGNLRQHDRREAAQSHYQASHQLYVELEDDYGAARTLAKQGMIAHHHGVYGQALDLHKASLKHFEALGDPRGIATVLVELGHNSLRLGRFTDGERYIRASMERFENLGDKLGVARSKFNLARACYWLGRTTELPALFHASLLTFQELGLRHDVAFVWTSISGAFCALGEYDRAWNNGLESLSYAQRHDFPRWIAFAQCWLGVVALVRGQFEDAAVYLRQSAAICRQLGQQDELASSLSYLSLAEHRLGQASPARNHLREALAICLQIKSIWSAVYTLPVVALFLAELGKLERAVEVYALIRRYPTAAAMQSPEDLAGCRIAELAANLPPESLEAARQRGQSLDLWGTVADLLAEAPFGRPDFSHFSFA